MKVEGYKESPNFTNLYNGHTIEKQLARKNCSQKFKNELKEIRSIMKANGFDKKENVDVYIEYNDNQYNKFFYGVISSKNQGTPDGFNNTKRISKESFVIAQFKDWLNGWNQAYDKNFLESIRNIAKTPNPEIHT